jgi:hypothetical protein
MSVTREYESPDFSDEFAEIERAVMESARGRWFLAEHARRERAADADLILAAIRRLEAALLSRSKPALANPEATTAQSAQIGQENMRYYRQDEDIFEPVPGMKADRPALRVISTPAIEPLAEPPAERMASRVTIKRVAPEASVQSEESAAESKPSTPVAPEAPAIVPTSSEPDKPRIFVVRRASSEELAIPLANTEAENAVA